MINGLHLGALGSCAVAQQYFDPLSNNAGYFVEKGATPSVILAFVLVLILGPPLALVAIEALVTLVSARARDRVHLVFVGGLVALFAWQRVNELGTGLPAPVAIALGAAVGGLAALAYARVRVVRAWVSVLAFAPLLFLALFLLFGSVSTLTVGGDGGRPAADIASGPPVVMVVLDEFPTGSLFDAGRRVDPIRYPNFAKLARGSTWYRNATTVADFTELAVPSLVTGVPARQKTLPVAADHPESVFTLLARGYRLDATESITELCGKQACPVRPAAPWPDRLRGLLAGSIDAVPALPSWARARIADAIAPAPKVIPALTRPYSGDVRRYVGAGAEDAEFDNFLTTLRPSGGGTLNYIHLLTPHRPWRFVPSGHQYPTKRPDFTGAFYGRWPTDGWTTTVAWQRHLLQVGMVDRLIGRLLRRLRATGLYDRSLVVVTADHGASFRPGDQSREVTPTNLEDVAYVPLFVKTPGQDAGKVDDSPATTLDVLPTIAKQVHARIPWKTPGHPLQDLNEPAGEGSISVRRFHGKGQVVLARRVAEQRRLASLRRRLRLFGARNNGPGLYKIGPDAELAGRPVSGFTLDPRARVRATLDDETVYRSVDLHAHVLPVNVTGTLISGAPRRRAIAIAINGRFAATAWTIVKAGTEYFTAIVPERALRPGANSVRVDAIERRGRERVLVPLF